MLRDGHCAALVVGNVRDGQGGKLLDLHSHTKSALEDAAGCELHEDIVLATPIHAAGMVASSCAKGAKFVRTHQHLVVACRGQALNAARAKKFHIGVRE